MAADKKDPKGYYKILGVKPNASVADIKKAYRERAKKLHPDQNSTSDADDAFKLLNDAYEILSDEVRRTAYDVRCSDEKPQNVKPEKKAAKPKKTASKGSSAKKPFLGKVATLINWGLSAAIWAVLIMVGAMIFYSYDLPDVDKAAAKKRSPSITTVAENGSIISSYGKVYGEVVEAKDFPKDLINAVLATEDRKFYTHCGIDFFGIARAMIRNLIAGKIKQGGSTITQQVAKNLFLSRERTIKRKIQELILTLWLEQKFTKTQILTLYFNRVYFGSGVYGIDAAAKRYYDSLVKDLTLYQSATLVGLLKAPSKYNPFNDKKAADKRAEQVIKNMVSAGFLTNKEAKKAKKTDIVSKPKRVGGGYYFSDWISGQIDSYISSPDKDITVKTTLDTKLQKHAEKILARWISSQKKDSNVTQGAFVAIDKSGAVRVMVGGYKYSESQFNRVTQALRQPGSAFKPFVYLMAVEEGYRPDDKVEDRPVTIKGWSPENYNNKYTGVVSLKQALAKSYNTVPVILADQLGRDKVISTARKMGIVSDMTEKPALPLGVSEVKLIDIVAAYAPFANDGFGVWAYGIEEIADSSGKKLYERSGSGSGRLISSVHASYMDEMLTYAVTDGTGRAAHLGIKTAGKTGTSQRNRDAWFIGYTDKYIAGVWLGNDNGTSMKGVGGSGLPAIIWREIMKKAHFEE